MTNLSTLITESDIRALCLTLAADRKLDSTSFICIDEVSVRKLESEMLIRVSADLMKKAQWTGPNKGLKFEGRTIHVIETVRRGQGRPNRHRAMLAVGTQYQKTPHMTAYMYRYSAKTDYDYKSILPGPWVPMNGRDYTDSLLSPLELEHAFKTLNSTRRNP